MSPSVGANVLLCHLAGDTTSHGCPCHLQESDSQVGSISQPITASGPQNVTGETALTQSLTGGLATANASSRGLTPAAPANTNVDPSVTVAVGGR